MNLLKGLFGTFRNKTAHVPKIMWKIEEEAEKWLKKEMERIDENI